MFEFLRKKKIAATIEDKLHTYLLILTNLIELLKSNNDNGQAAYVEELVRLIQQKDINQFIKSINTVDMWGGSGAVWEVGFKDPTKKHLFQKEIVRLIDLMEETNIIGSGIKAIRRLFENELYG